MEKRFTRLPEKGIEHEKILEMMRAMSKQDVHYKEGKTWSLVYHAGEEHTDFLKQAHGLFFETNGLNPMAFLSLQQFERDVVRMSASMLHGDENVVGTMSSGGTESIFLAVKTYRDMAKHKRPWILRPNIIVPASAHVAFDKAAEYLGVRLVHAPLNQGFQVDVKAVKHRINHNTILLVGSAPSYPYGVVDPIPELGELALKKGLPLHVDSCLGGFLLPFVERLEYGVPRFDFRVPGVTSMSADVHKYGYAAKGASVILYRNMDYLEHQFFVDVDWPGGVFVSAGLPGTRPGGSIAAAWAAMLAFGDAGYLDMAAQTMETTKMLEKGIESIPELEVLGRPNMSVFAFRSKDRDINIYAVGDLMEARGWHIDRLQNPAALHAMVTMVHKKSAKKYITDLRASVLDLREHPKRAQTGSAPMYGLMARMPLRGMVKKNVLEIMKKMYSAKGDLPDLSSDGDAASDPLVKIGLRAIALWDKVKERIPRP